MSTIIQMMFLLSKKIKGFVRKITSTFPITCPDSVDDDSLINMSIEGNSYQDGEPTFNNPIEIQSVGEKTANMLVYPYADTTKEVNGLTFVDNGDGTITVNGTANATTSFPLATIKGITDITQKYYLTGAPIGGSYYICIMVYYYYNNKYVGEQYDKGDGLLIELSSLGYEVDEIRFYVRVGNGKTADNLIFKPMLQTYDSINNLLTYPYYDTTKTISDVTFIDNGDGTITANGTATAYAPFYLIKNSYEMKAGKNYRLFSSKNLPMIVSYKVNGTTNYISTGSTGLLTFTWDESWSLGNIYLQLTSGKTLENETVLPKFEMIDGDGYEPYGYKTPIVAETENLFVEGLPTYGFWTSYVNGNGFKGYGSAVAENAKTKTLFKANHTYTLSFDMEMIAKGTNGTYKNSHYGLSIFSSTLGQHILNGLSLEQLEVGERVHINATATMPDNLDELNLSFYYYSGRYVDENSVSSDYDTIRFTNIKIEEADHETEPIVSNVYLKEPIRGINQTYKDVLDVKKGECTRNIKENDVIIESKVIASNLSVGIYTPSDKIQQSHAGVKSEKSLYSRTIKENCLTENRVNFVFTGSADDTLETLKAKYDGSKIVYVLAEPITEKIIAPNIPTFKHGTTYSIATTVQPLSGTVEYYSTTKGV